MKILSITTSSNICGVAILEDRTLIKQINLNNGLTHSKNLMPTIQAVLEDSYLTLNDIDLLAVDIGPGSFTGIRIGISTIKAFKDSLNIKAIGINSMEGLSLNVEINSIICTLIDAKKGNVYSEIFEHKHNKTIVKRKASFDNLTDVLLEIKNINPKYNVTFVGDGVKAYKDTILERLPNSKFIENNEILAVNIGIYAYEYYLSKIFPNIEPLYLRKTLAEQNFEQRNNKI